MSTIGERLKEERERLGMTIPALAEIAGAKKNTVIDWQKDLSSPPAAKLAALADVGVDVMYVLTGQKKHFSGYTDEHIKRGVAQYLLEALDMGMFELNKGVSFDFAVELAQQCIRKTAGLGGMAPTRSAKAGGKSA